MKTDQTVVRAPTPRRRRRLGFGIVTSTGGKIRHVIMESVDNPLLEIQFRIPFDKIRAEHVEPAMDELLAAARARQGELARSTGERTFANTLLALESMTETLDYALGVVRHLESVATYPEL